MNLIENPVTRSNSLVQYLELFKDKICQFAGHRWRYKDYSHFMKSNGDRYDFKASRKCTRCRQNAYFHDTWKNSDKSIYDFESDYHSSPEISINNIIYS